jgi:GT2 family glycosyltransferase
MTRRPISIVIATHNEGDLLRDTVEALADTAPEAELVVVDDGSTDESCDFLTAHRWRDVAFLRPGRRLGVAAARNLGASRATGRGLVFIDAHVEPGDGWAEALLRELGNTGTGAAAPAITDLGGLRSAYGYGFTWQDSAMVASWLTDCPPATSAVPFVSGCFLATPRHVFDELGGFDSGLRTWGYEDAEYSLRVWLAGYRCVVAPEARVAHRFQSTFTYDVEPAAVLHNRLRVGVLHLSPSALARLLHDARCDPHFAAAFETLMESNVWRRRDLIRSVRRRSDVWFFSQFGIRAFT